jgi:hypothetical protein
MKTKYAHMAAKRRPHAVMKLAVASALFFAPLVSTRAQDTIQMDTSASQMCIQSFKVSFNVDTSLNDLRFISKKGRDGADYTYFKSLLDGFEKGRLNLDKVDTAYMDNFMAGPGTRVLKLIDIRSGTFNAQLDAGIDEKGKTTVAIVSRGANKRNDRLFVSEVLIPKKCKVLRCDPFFMRDTKDVAEIGVYIKYKDRRDGEKYQIMLKVLYSKTSIGIVKTTVVLMNMNDRDMGTVYYINGQKGPQ